MSNGNKYKIENTNIDSVGFQARLRGDAIRDCLLLLLPENKCDLRLLTRSEIEGTVLESVLRNQGSATLDIGKSRISIPANDANSRPNGLHISNRSSAFSITLGNYQKEEHSANTLNLKEGRFPSNLILKHGPNCECIGTKKVKPSNGSGTEHQNNKEIANTVYQGEWNPKGVSGTAGEDGKEEVADWNCEPGCPVSAMDTQSGILVTRWGKQGESQGVGSMFFGTHTPNGSSADRFIGESGGASRFFKQVHEEDELDEYLNVLIRKG